ncbi:MAG TPA: TrbI/VirB10 family protein [Candidatus Limnocylindria bacterium]|jgi:type IV secretory pathway VirB10-like protein|nr:TrbI/VirB10 family protein [Candidatus Limnocylindria bacterium]
MANSPRIPTSPDELDGGIRGRISGVTRVGPRAIAAAFVVVCGLLIAILYGVNKNSNKQAVNTALATPPPAIPSDEPHFGSNVPIVATPSPPTPPPPLVLPTTSVPDVARTTTTHASTESAAEQAERQSELAEQEARREEERQREEALASAEKAPILAAGGSGTQLAFTGNGESGGAAAPPAQAETPAQAPAQPQATPAPTFLDGPTGQYRVNAANVALPNGGNPKDFLQAQRFAPLSRYEITASSVIPASLITAIDSEEPGLITAQVREDVYDTKTGRYLLIPRGSRLVGVYKSEAQYGQTRVLVAWQRLIFPDTTSIDLLNMSGADVEGGAGFGGVVDNHYGKIIGAALLTSVLAAGLQLSQPQQGNIYVMPSAGQIAAGAVGQQLAQTGMSIVNKNVNIPPTIHVAKGYPFDVIVDRDIILPGTYHGQ